MRPGGSFSLLAFCGALVGGSGTARSQHRVAVTIRGAVAEVEVTRALTVSARERAESTLDLDLPAGAALLGWELVTRGGKRIEAHPTDEAKARAAYKEALSVHRELSNKAPMDEGTGFRVHASGLTRPADPVLRYRYALLVGCDRGTFAVPFPGSLEADPSPAEVEVRVHAGGDPVRAVRIAGEAVKPRGGLARGRAPARAAWTIELVTAPPPATFPAAVLVSSAALASGRAAAVAICRPERQPKPATPAHVVLAIDRSRSVGMAGMAGIRDAARAIIEALPPSIRFNAVLFDRTATPLFQGPRAATLEAIRALEEAASPGSLRNGTNLPAGLAGAAALLRGETEATRSWLVLLTDGAIPAGQSAAAVRRALAALPPAGTDAIVLAVRPDADEPPAASAAEALRAVPEAFGGVLRFVTPGQVRDGVEDAMADLGKGGDLFAVTIGSPRGLVAGSIGAGEGRGALLIVRRDAPTVLGASFRGRRIERALGAATIPRAVANALLAPARRAVLFGASADAALLVEPGPVEPGAPDAVTRGEMDKQVVRNALQLAFLPRARACYLDRRVAGPGDLNLRGRVRLELELERGEMVDAAVRSSTLARPDIETCLREAAFAVEIPRPLHRDAPVTAALNLVFQPRTSGTPDAGPRGPDELDVLLGPITFPGDPRELLLDAPGKP